MKKMTRRTLSIIVASGAALLTATIALAQVWQPLSGVLPSYLQPPLKPVSRVASQSALDNALNRAQGGEIIGLAPGNYSVQLKNRVFFKPVMLTSADPKKPAVISWIKLEDVSDLTFTRLELARTIRPGEKVEGTYVGTIWGGANITLDAVFVHGSLDNDASNDMTGLNFGRVNNLRVVNSEFTQLGRGAVFNGVDNVTVANNKVHAIRSDGFNFVQSQKVLVDGNHFSDSQRALKDHPDAIQFWTLKTSRPSTDIVIRNNQIIQGNGSGTQGIFMRDEGLNMPFERVLIENNLVVASNMANGIYLDNGIDVSIINNTVLSRVDGVNPVWIKLKNVKDPKVEGNIADIGGNKTVGGAKIDKSLLKGDRFNTVVAEDVVVPGIGFQIREPKQSRPETSTK